MNFLLIVDTIHVLCFLDAKVELLHDNLDIDDKFPDFDVNPDNI